MSLDPVISARELAALTDVVVLDCRPDARAYSAGHLIGARHAQLERDLAAPPRDPAHGGRHPLPSVHDFAATLGRWGRLPPNTQAYDMMIDDLAVFEKHTDELNKIAVKQ